MLSLPGWFRASRRPRKSTPQRPTFRPSFERLESRELLSASPLPPSLSSGPTTASVGAPAHQSTPLDQMQILAQAPSIGASPSIQAAAAASGPGLYINDQKVTSINSPYYQDLVNKPGLANPALRDQIFKAMMNNPAFTFQFSSWQQAETNFEIRINTINFMNTVQKGFVGAQQGQPPVYATKPGQFSYSGATAGTTPYANSAYWLPPTADSKGTETFTTKPLGMGGGPLYNNYAAIMSITQAPFRGGCYVTAELAVLYGIAKTVGPTIFNHLFPSALIIGANSTSDAINQVMTGYLGAPPFNPSNVGVVTTSDMVPGDWVCMKNVTGPGGYKASDGAWTGENAIYLGKYSINGGPATQVFSGLGLFDVSQGELQQDLWSALAALHPGDPNYPAQVPAWVLNQANPDDILWEVDRSPGLFGQGGQYP